jgi:hypothetical protein
MLLDRKRISLVLSSPPISRRRLLGAAGMLAAGLWPWPAMASRARPLRMDARASLTGLNYSPYYEGSASVALTYQPGSSVKVEQIIGDVDYATLASGNRLATASQTVSRYNVAGTDLGNSFEHQGKLVFLFGDTISNNPAMPWSTSTDPMVAYRAGDAIAWTVSTDGESGLLLNFYTNGDGSPLFVRPPGVAMGADDVPNAGISLNGQIYLVVNTGSDTSNPNPHAKDYSVLAKFDEKAQTFATGRTISEMPDGHFIITTLHDDPSPGDFSAPTVLMFGLGAYRATNVYLAAIPAASFESGAGTQYFTGLNQGQPAWSQKESDAAPVVSDVVNPPTIGNVSVIYSDDLRLWLMTFDGGRGSENTNGIYFSYSPAPWGPWSVPQFIFNVARDNGLGVFISNYDPRSPSIAGAPAGPTIGPNDILRTRGGDYAPYMIERFTRVDGDTLTIYYTMSTWNPYTVVKMRSWFTLVQTGGAVQ